MIDNKNVLILKNIISRMNLKCHLIKFKTITDDNISKDDLLVVLDKLVDELNYSINYINNSVIFIDLLNNQCS